MGIALAGTFCYPFHVYYCEYEQIVSEIISLKSKFLPSP